MSTGLIGGVGLTYLRVYDETPGPDGIHAGCAHVHAFTSEAYFGIAGRGALELHHPETGYQRVPITKGVFVQFPPGVLHRSVSDDALEVLVIMDHQGLAERGDARIYFGQDADAEPGRYEALRALAASGLDGALNRRDASSEAYARLEELRRQDDAAYRAELRRFYDLHRNNVAHLADEQESRNTIGTGLSPVDFIRSVKLDDAPIIHGMCGLLQQVSLTNPGNNS